MQKNLSSSVAIASFSPDTAKKLFELLSEVEKAQQEALNLFSNSPRYQALVDLAANSYGGKTSPMLTVSGTTINVSVVVELADTGSAPQMHRHLDPKTINLLLSGKLLSDQEKRLLIGRLTNGLFDQPETEK